MRFVSNFPMTTDQELAGNCPTRHQWDLSFLDVDSCPRLNSSRPVNNRRTSTTDATESPFKDTDVSLCQLPNSLPHSPSCMTKAKVIGAGKAFRVDNVRVDRMDNGRVDNAGGVFPPNLTMLGFGLCKIPQSSDNQHIYENGGLHLDDVSSIVGDDDVLVGHVSRINMDDGSRFFFPVVHSPRPHGVNTPHGANTPPRSFIPWLTVAPTGSETDTESRSQSISSQDSSDQDNIGFRIRDDSGVGMTWNGEILPRRNSSAPALNDLSVVVCRPSPSPIIEFHNETLHHVDLRKIDNIIDESSARLNSLITDDAPSHDAYMRIARFLPSWDLERLSTVFYRLNICRFYLGKVSFDDAKVLLRGYPVGTFLLRDSSDSRYLFTLSVQTTRGTTSIRVVYEAGHFRLDCDVEQIHLMPTFDCVIRLVQHYVRIATAYSRRGLRNNFVFLESSGRKDTPVLLRMPYANQPASLKHLCRLKINGSLGTNSVDRLQLIPSLKTFLRDYPYDI